MTFPSILPHLHAGRKATRTGWDKPHLYCKLGHEMLMRWNPAGSPCIGVTEADLLATDWELVDEPTQVNDCTCSKPAGSRHRPSCPGWLWSENQRLTREHSEFASTARRRELEHEAEFARLTRELELERDNLAGLRSTADRLTRELASARGSLESVTLERDNYRRITLSDLEAVVRKARP